MNDPNKKDLSVHFKKSPLEEVHLVYQCADAIELSETNVSINTTLLYSPCRNILAALVSSYLAFLSAGQAKS
jgi:hypothetical protein